MSEIEATNPVDDEVLDTTSEQGVAEEAQAQGDDQTQDEQDSEEQPDDDAEEIEHEGQKYKLPKALKPLLLMQADYTRKTQEVAEQRKALDTERNSLTQQAELHSQTLEQRVQLKQVEAQLQQFNDVDWRAYTTQYGADETAVAMSQWRQLEAAKAALQQDITSKESEHRLSGERARATALQEAEQELSRDLKGYGPDLVRGIAVTAQQYGFTPDELRDSLVGDGGKADTRAFKLLARLHSAETELARLQKKTTTAQAVEKQTAVQPAKTVGAKAGGYKPGLNDELPADEWLRRFNADRNRHRKGA